MIFDSLTIATIVVFIIVLLLVFGSIIYSHYTMKKNMRILARNAILMNADEEIKDLCKKIMAVNPDSCPLMDGKASKLVKADPEKLKQVLEEHLRKLEKQHS